MPNGLEEARKRVQTYMIEAVGAAGVVLFGTMMFWVLTLKKDIRVRRATELELVEHQQRLELALSAAEIGAWQWDVATDMSTRDATLNRMLGLEAAESTQGLDDLFDRIVAEDRVAVRGEFNRAIQDRDTYVTEYRIVRPDGSLRWLRGRGRAFYDGDGRPSHVTGATIDVTDRREAEAALRGSEEKFAKAFQASPDCIAISDLESEGIIEINDRFEEITGYAREDVMGRSVESLDMFEALVRDARMAVVREQGSFRDFEFQIRRKDGQPATILMSGGIMEIAGRKRLLTVSRDITGRKELELQLRQAQKMDAIGRLAAGVAHDFNNLLTVILGNCEVATPLLKPDDPVQDTLRDIRASAERAAGLTTQLLAFSRRQIIQPRVLNVNETIGEIRRMMTRLIGEHIGVRFVPGQDLWHVSADPGQLQQVIVNLVVNARDAMPEGGRLTIETRNIQFAQDHVERGAKVPAGDYVEICVEDTGTGMEAATIERLFEPFFTTKDAGKGTGLGLATVYGIVKQSDGFVFVDSAPGAGATFWILLPRADAPVTAMSPAETLRGASTGGQETVLLVEDEDDVRELIHDYLEGQGYTVLSASTGEEGIALLHDVSDPPALLISDIVMPGMNGRVLSDHLRATYPHLKVLYVSGYTDDGHVRHSLLPQGTHFLQKPFALSTLATKIRDIVDAAGV